LTTYPDLLEHYHSQQQLPATHSTWLSFAHPGKMLRALRRWDVSSVESILDPEDGMTHFFEFSYFIIQFIYFSNVTFM